MPDKRKLIDYYNGIADRIDHWRKRNRLYYKTVRNYYSFIIPEGSRVLEIGSGTGDLLHSVKPSRGVGIDFSQKMVDIARRKYPDLEFLCLDAEQFQLDEQFDYIILSDILSVLTDVQAALRCIRPMAHERTRIIISNHNYLWTPIIRLAEKIRIKFRQPLQNWLSNRDIELLLSLEGFEPIKTDRKLLLPLYIPVFNWLFNKIIANLPLINHLNLIFFMVARPAEKIRFQ